jgi:t-SNARE complex subunit (syntaxin)
MILRFFKLPKHRTFNYKPRYYDPIKDEVQERVKLIEQEMSEGKEYTPGANIRGNMKRQLRSSRTEVKKNRGQMLIIRLVLMLIIFLVLYFVQRFL